MDNVTQDVRNIVSYQGRVYQTSAARIRIPEVDQYLSELGRIVLAAASKQGINDKSNRDSERLDIYDRFDVYLLHEALPNAATHGDDFATVTTALFLSADSHEELIGVLCHEFGHIYKGHSVRKRFKIRQEYDKTTALAALAGAVAGAAGTGMDLPIAVIRARTQWLATYQPFDKNDEFEADDYGLTIYLSTGLDPTYYDDFFERSVRNFGDTASPTHPVTSERIHRIRARLDAMKPQQGQQNNIQMDTTPLKDCQARVAVYLIEMHQRQTLFAQSFVNSHLNQLGHTTYPIDACGPLDVPEAICYQQLNASIDRHYPR